mmetsp:Transcript_8481/g.12649  ORF Transcript_8481/g.12649 Transcript_8481/m.12649 type:complete len:301 (-) Transcript_8481:52-954(-)
MAFAAISDIVECPVVILLTAVLVSTFVQIYRYRIESKSLSFSYNDCVKRDQWWRVVVSSFSHTSWLHLSLDIIFLWDVRQSEVLFGSFFFLKYTLLLVVAHKLFQLIYFKCLMSFLPRFAPALQSMQTVGFTGVIFGWMGFMSVFMASKNSTVHLLGFFPVSIYFAPSLLLLVYQLALPQSSQTPASVSGLICGILLAVGPLRILPDAYWTFCFGVDILLLTLLSWYRTWVDSGNVAESVHVAEPVPQLADDLQYEYDTDLLARLQRAMYNRRRNPDGVGADIETGQYEPSNVLNDEISG